MQLHKSFLTVVVVGVDDGERLLDDALAGQHGLAGAPGFGAALGHTVTRGHIFQCLKRIVDLDTQVGADLLDAVADGLFKGFLDIVADDKDDLVKASFDGVVDRVIHDDLAVGADCGQLFDAAAETGAYTGRHNNQSCFHEFPPKLSLGCVPGVVTFYLPYFSTSCGQFMHPPWS